MAAPGSSPGLGAPAGSASLARGFNVPGQEETEEASKSGRGNWLVTHPMFTKMMYLDVADSSAVYAAFLVYLDLLEVRNWHEVSCFALAEFQLVGLRGREREAEDFQVVVPTPAHVSFSHERLRQIMRASTLEENPDSPSSLVLAIIESDSTIVYYKLTDGFVMPTPPDDTEELDNKQWRKNKKKKARRH